MQNFMQIPPRGASRQMGEISARIFLYMPFFQRSHRSDPLRDFYAKYVKRHGSAQ